MSPAALALIAVTVLATSFLSGIFGMAGGLILLGVLLVFMDVAPAMVLFGAIQMGANGWRALLWREHVAWPIVLRFMAGSLAAFIAMRFIAFIPDKAIVYIGLGVLPFITEVLPARWQPDISRPGGPYLCGIIIMVLQLLAGAAGHILDMYFQKSGLDRRGIVGSKAACQTAAHLFRILYFGSFASALDVSVPWWAFAGALAIAFTGTTLAARVLESMTETNFRAWSRRIIFGIALSFLARGLWLLAMP